MVVEPCYDPRTSTLTYLVFDEATKDAVVIDPVLDYEPAASKVWTECVDNIAAKIIARGLTLHYIMETHAHADHLSGSQMLRERFPDARTAVGRGITIVQRTFKQVFGLPDDFPTDGSQFGRLIDDGETISAGSLKIRTLFTPGHTPACVSYVIGDAVFTGDAMFMPDIGTGRCDFPAGSAADMYRSIVGRLYTLPDETAVYVGHDYQPGGRELRFRTTIGEQKATNAQLPAGLDEAAFVERRTARDATLSTPKLLFQSVQVNIDAGTLPQPSDNATRYLRIPINIFRPDAHGDIELGDANPSTD